MNIIPCSVRLERLSQAEIHQLTVASNEPTKKRKFTNEKTDEGETSVDDWIVYDPEEDEAVQRRIKKLANGKYINSSNRTYARRQSAIEAERRSRGIKPFHCMWPDCEMKCPTKRSMARHVANTHIGSPKMDSGSGTNTPSLPSSETDEESQLGDGVLNDTTVYDWITYDQKDDEAAKSNVTKVGNGRFKSSSDKIYYQRHQALHEERMLQGIRPFHCMWPGCDRSHVNKHDTAVHVARKHFVAKYRCGHNGCNETFFFLRKYRIHTMSHSDADD